jgi:predicted MFS family arabinose efflux permease
MLLLVQWLEWKDRFSKFAEVEFGMASKTAILSFIVAFGVTKAITNYFTGKLANRFGRKIYFYLVGFSHSVPFILIYASSWNWVILY